jgi:hypothetical protein
MATIWRARRAHLVHADVAQQEGSEIYDAKRRADYGGIAP